jgi:RNA-directed DNA polymerase
LVTIDEIFQAYYDCRKHKRLAAQQLEFEENLFGNLLELHQQLESQTYQISQSTVFVIKSPKPREVWSANFRDRIVHHVLYNRVKNFYFAKFDYHSFACIPKKGTTNAAKSACKSMRKITENWTKKKYYLKCDIKSFFISIDKIKLLQIIERDFSIDTVEYKLFSQIILNDPTIWHKVNSSQKEMNMVQSYKKLKNANPQCGLLIGNLSSQLCGNIYLNDLDFFCRNTLKIPHYFRYVDDILIFGNSNLELKDILKKITYFLQENLSLTLNNSKTIIQPLHNGVKFVGHIIKPFRIYTQRSTTNRAFHKCKKQVPLLCSVNSYFGLFGQTNSFRVRTEYARLLKIKNINTNNAITKAIF